MRLARVVAVLALATAPAALAAQDFEGVITQKVTAPGASGEAILSVKGNMLRMEFSGMPGGMIVNSETSEMIMLMPQMKQYMKMSAEQMAAMAGQSAQEEKMPEFTKTGKTETIIGHTCEYYNMKFDGGEADMCIATDMGFYFNAGSPSMGRGRGGQQGISAKAIREFAKQFKDGFFPLKVIISSPQGGATTEVTKVEKKTLSDDLFKAPSGWTEMKMPGMGELN